MSLGPRPISLHRDPSSHFENNSSWFVQPFAHNTPTSQTQDRQRDRTGETGWRSDSIGWTVLQTVAQKFKTGWKHWIWEYWFVNHSITVHYRETWELTWDCALPFCTHSSVRTDLLLTTKWFWSEALSGVTGTHTHIQYTCMNTHARTHARTHCTHACTAHMHAHTRHWFNYHFHVKLLFSCPLTEMHGRSAFHLPSDGKTSVSSRAK